MKFITSILFFFLALAALAQQMEAVSQFEQNLMYYNPATTGREGVLTANFFYRAHWLGMTGAPSTGVFNVHAPLKNPAVALGLSLDHQSTGASNYTGVYFNYAYRIRVGDQKLSFGIKGGIRSASRKMPTLEESQSDDAFSDQNLNYVLPNFGFGILYHGEKYWAGFSVPKLLGESTNGSGKYTVKADSVSRDFILVGGGNFLLTDDIVVSPSLFLLYNTGAPIKFAVLATGTYKETFRFGLGYRGEGAMILLAGYNIDRRTRLAYSYDLYFGELSTFSSGSHEFSIQYSLGYKVNTVNPRGF